MATSAEHHRKQANRVRSSGRPYYLPLCRRGEHVEQVHHADYDGCCDCPCHGRVGGRATHWGNGERV